MTDAKRRCPIAFSGCPNSSSRTEFLYKHSKNNGSKRNQIDTCMMMSILMSNKIYTYRNHVKEYNYQQTAMQNETCSSSSSLHSNANSDCRILTSLLYDSQYSLCDAGSFLLECSRKWFSILYATLGHSSSYVPVRTHADSGRKTRQNLQYKKHIPTKILRRRIPCRYADGKSQFPPWNPCESRNQLRPTAILVLLSSVGAKDASQLFDFCYIWRLLSTPLLGDGDKLFNELLTLQESHEGF